MTVNAINKEGSYFYGKSNGFECSLGLFQGSDYFKGLRVSKLYKATLYLDNRMAASEKIFIGNLFFQAVYFHHDCKRIFLSSD